MYVHYIDGPDGKPVVTMTVGHYPYNYEDCLPADAKWLKLTERMAHDGFRIERDASGKVRAFEAGGAREIAQAVMLAKLQIVAPATLTVGVEATFAGVPPGTRILLNGELLDTMDDSGVYEFTPLSVGRYAMRFELDGFRPLEMILEAIG